MSEDVLKLLTKAIDKQLSKEEEEHLQEWLDNDESNRKLYSHVRSFFSNQATLPQIEQERKEAIRGVILRRIAIVENGNDCKQGKGTRRMWPLYGSIAAAFVIMLTVASGLLFLTDRKDSITYTEFYAPLGEKLTITLPDSTVVNLNSDTHLRYASNFNTSDRVVEMEGEAYFQVKKQNGRLFQVKTEAMEIKVRGTVFNIRSYKNDNEMLAQLYEGSVDLSLPAIGKEFTMEVGDKVIYDIDKKDFRIEKNVEDRCSWLQGEYKFYNERLGSLVNMLNRVFKTDIRFRNEALRDEYYTGTILEQKGLGRILHLLEVSADIRVEHEGNQIFLNK